MSAERAKIHAKNLRNFVYYCAVSNELFSAQKMDGKFVRVRKNFMGAKHEKRFVSLFDLHDSFRADLYFPFLLVAGRYLSLFWVKKGIVKQRGKSLSAYLKVYAGMCIFAGFFLIIPLSWLIWFTSIAGSAGCIRMQSLIRGNQTRTTGWLPTCIRTCGPMR